MLSSPSPYQKNLWTGRNIGLLGGSFNPAHEGHRHISLYALKHLGLDAIWWMVSPQNPLKSTKGMAPIKERIESALQASRHKKIIVTDIEQHLHTRYTADTLSSLKTHFPETNFIWLMGSDNLHQIHHWEKWEKIFKTVPIAVLDRPPRGNSLKACPAIERFRKYIKPEDQSALLKLAKPPALSIIHIPLSHASATKIRENKALQKK